MEGVIRADIHTYMCRMIRTYAYMCGMDGWFAGEFGYMFVLVCMGDGHGFSLAYNSTASRSVIIMNIEPQLT